MKEHDARVALTGPNAQACHFCRPDTGLCVGVGPASPRREAARVPSSPRQW
ncbi:DUF6233 domain-containing protein [Streptomyces sp. NPDC006365]|uniref:DUF6233 domain-containing protein n=1 Tax=Streptomyces sp. NPDC006365 TaxID=3364744 RepID=UPI0036BE052A